MLTTAQAAVRVGRAKTWVRTQKGLLRWVEKGGKAMFFAASLEAYCVGRALGVSVPELEMMQVSAMLASVDCRQAGFLKAIEGRKGGRRA